MNVHVSNAVHTSKEWIAVMHMSGSDISNGLHTVGVNVRNVDHPTRKHVYVYTYIYTYRKSIYI